jgi:hypothetical protein
VGESGRRPNVAALDRLDFTADELSAIERVLKG